MSFIKIQADPYAPPSIASYSISCAYANFPKELISDGNKKTAVEDFLLRRIYKQLIGKGRICFNFLREYCFLIILYYS